MTVTPDRAAVLDLIRSDAAAGRLARWGRSTVIDENTGVPSFDEPLFAELHAAAEIDADFPVGNAGLLHVYGYWFSDVMTPYGLKRERWLDGKLATALGLPADAFHLHDRGATTPLERVMNATLPLLGDPPRGALVAEASLDVAPELTRRSRVVCLPAHDGHPAVLIYGIEASGAQSTMQLVTVFPFQGDPSGVIAEFAHTPRFRWNAMP